MKKVYGSAAEALDGLLHDGMFIAAGGFGLCGIPELLIDAIRALRADGMGMDRIARKLKCGKGLSQRVCQEFDKEMADG